MSGLIGLLVDLAVLDTVVKSTKKLQKGNRIDRLI